MPTFIRLIELSITM